MQGRDAVSAAALELDDGPVDLVIASVLCELLAIDSDDASISISFSAWPATLLLAR
jgi:hypothetical protein